MQPPTLQQDRAHPPAPGPARRRGPIILVAATLVTLIVGVGVAVALANRPAVSATAPAAPVAVVDQPTPAPNPTPAPQPAPTPAPNPTPPKRPAVLADGSYDTLIRSIDPARRTVVLDLIQVFHDGAAVKAAVEDGRSPADAQYLTIWIRNQNPRLRTLPLASDLRVQLWGSCDEDQATRPVLTQLADGARHHLYYLSVTVRDGAVRRFEEHQIQPAC